MGSGLPKILANIFHLYENPTTHKWNYFHKRKKATIRKFTFSLLLLGSCTAWRSWLCIVIQFARHVKHLCTPPSLSTPYIHTKKSLIFDEICFFLFHLLFYQILILFLPKCSNVCVSLDRIKQFGSNGLNPKTTNTKKMNSKHCTFLRFNVT